SVRSVVTLSISAAHDDKLFVITDAATTGTYPLSLHDALPIFTAPGQTSGIEVRGVFEDGMVRDLSSPEVGTTFATDNPGVVAIRSEEHTSELQSRENLVCRLLLEKKKKTSTNVNIPSTHEQLL